MTTSSTGGKIIHTTGGLIHYGNTERFITEQVTDSVKQTGRRTKESVESGLKFDFSAFLSPVKLTSTTGQLVKFK